MWKDFDMINGKSFLTSGIVATAVLFTGSPLFAAPGTVSTQERRRLRHDHRDLISDRRDIRGDRRDIYNDRKELRGDRRELVRGSPRAPSGSQKRLRQNRDHTRREGNSSGS